MGFDSYTPVADIAVIAVCSAVFILLATSYVNRTRSFRIFSSIVGVVFLAAMVNIGYHMLLAENLFELRGLIYTLRVFYHSLLFDVFFLFILYTTVVSDLERKKSRTIVMISSGLFVAVVGLDVLMTIIGIGFRIGEDGIIREGSNVFLFGYTLFFILLVSVMLRIRKLVYKRILSGFFAIMGLTVFIRFTQLPFGQQSLTTMTFVLPVIAMLYIMHANPLNITVGTLDVRSMEDMVRNLYEKKAPFVFMSLLLPEFNEGSKPLPDEVSAQVRHFSREYFRNGVLFKVGNGHIVMLAKKQSRRDIEKWMADILVAFQVQYDQMKYPFKIVYGESFDEISAQNKYIRLIKTIQRSLPDNTVYRVRPEDIVEFNRKQYITSELADIYKKRDLDDPRVLVFCQPVLNLKTDSFDTAEALMRLKLEETGMVYPNDFIPVAEEHGFIHALTEIILHKTCLELKKLLDEGFEINRISVNSSVLEMTDDGYCGDIESIIRNSGVPSEKIALELTESHTDKDYEIMKAKIEELRKVGIKFYLDDFGTGYSNMERIIDLPFDVIKFDRSILASSLESARSKRMVENMARTFKESGFQVLYEGVENEEYEACCRDMAATYLQGFKYSRPIPIEKIREYLTKVG